MAVGIALSISLLHADGEQAWETARGRLEAANGASAHSPLIRIQAIAALNSQETDDVNSVLVHEGKGMSL